MWYPFTLARCILEKNVLVNKRQKCCPGSWTNIFSSFFIILTFWLRPTHQPSASQVYAGCLLGHIFSSFHSFKSACVSSCIQRHYGCSGGALEYACVRRAKSSSGFGFLSKPSAVGAWLCALKTIIALCSGKCFPIHNLQWSWHCIKITCWLHISLPQPCNYIFDKREERGWRKV